MSRDPHHGAADRDKALARLLRHSVYGTAAEPACPDAEVLAAYADHGLDRDQASQWESHFAACDRCRGVLAALVVGAEEPVAPQPQPREERRDQFVAAATVPAPSQALASKQRVVSLVRRPMWWPMRWLVPALGAAAGVALWFALQPAQPLTQTMPTQTIVQSPAVVPSAPGTDSEIAQDEAPRASSSQPTLLAQRSAAELRREPEASQEQESDEALTASAAPPADVSDSTAFTIARGGGVASDCSVRRSARCYRRCDR